MQQGYSFYESPEIKVTLFILEDVVRTSNPGADDSTPEGGAQFPGGDDGWM
ncbi:MAG: hypothetical protein IKD47_02210 [Clostridia bacterium]|nr:hypothetical protein [Clostridia bacterium]